MRIPSTAVYKKSAPKRYKAKDAPYAVGGNGGIIISMRPRPYPTTPQQENISFAAKACGIKSGATKATIMNAMKNCLKGKDAFKAAVEKGRKLV